MTILNEPNRGQRRRDTGPQFRCHTGTRILGRIGKCRTGGNTIMAAKLDATAWAEMIRLFQAPGELTAELQAARAQAAAQHTEAAQPVDDLTTRIADAERRLASLRKRPSEKSSPPGQAPQHQADHTDVDERLAGAAQQLVVLTEPAGGGLPRGLPFHHPPSWI